MRNGKHIRPLALLLSAALLVTQLPAVAMAENRVPEDGSIASFAALPGDVEKQAVTLGTELSALELPDTVKAAVYHVTADTAIPDEGNPEEENSGISTATPSEAGDGVSGNNAGSSSGKDSGNTVTTVTTSEEEIPVTWGSEPAYDGDRLGDYVFTADVGGYVLSNSAKLPQITVTVSAETVENPTEAPPTEPLPCTMTEGCTLPAGHEGECVTKQPPANGPLVKTVTGWTFVDDDLLTGNELSIPNVNVGHQADFDTVVSMLPTQISAEIDGETELATLDIIGWSCPEFAKGSDGNWPLTGEYTFTAKLQEGYACEPLPTVKVLVGGAELYGTEVAVGDFTVTGDPKQYDWKAPVLTIKSGATLTIQNTTPQTSTTHRIKVASGATNVNITLAGVNIDLSAVNTVGQACAFDMTGASVNLTLAGGSSNFLISNSIYAGLQVPEGATLTVDGTGELEAVCEVNGAGIGSCQNQSGGNITIQGSVQVRAKGGNGAGIGSGNVSVAGGESGAITIQDSAWVTAESDWGAGIGGGFEGNSGAITIQNSAQVTAESNKGAGIGGGWGGNSGAITIQNGAQVTATSNEGAGIGGGSLFTGSSDKTGKGGDVVISGENTRVVARSEAGNDIGSGSECTVGGTLKVTGGATLEMQNSGTNVNTPDYKECTVIDSQGSKVEYDTEGKVIPALSLEADPEGSLELPGNITLTATLSDAASGNAGRTITFTVNSTTHSATTDDFGKASYTVTSPSAGTYTFGASFAGDAENKQVAANKISGYAVTLGTQAALTLNGLGSAYTYGDAAFTLSIAGGSGNGAVSYTSSDSSVASVTGSTVTILKAGTFTITATKAADSSYAEASVTSPEVTIIEATPNVSLIATGGSTTSEALILTATVPKVGTGTTPIGTVTFKKGNTQLGNVTLDGTGNASYTISSPEAGSYEYTAEYSGQSSYYKAASASRTIGVGLTDQTGFAIIDPGAKTYGDGDFTLTATGGQSAGGVSFSVPSGNGVLTVAADGKVTITGAGKVTVTATKAGDSTYNQATATREITVAPRNISHVTVNVTGSRVYTGSQLQPVFEVKDGAIAVTTGDYTNSYGSNVDAGTDAGSITLTGQRNYTGTKVVTFDIEKRPLTGAAITLAAGPYTHTGGEIKPAVTSVMVDGITVPTAELDVGYANNTAVGTATVTVTAKAGGNFSGSASATYEITENSNPSGGGGGASSSDDSSDPEPQGSYKVTGDSISRSVSRSDLKRLADTGKSLTLACGKASMTFEPAALKAILAAVPSTAGNITFAAAPADLSAFPNAVKLIGSRPVYSFTISYKNSRGITETATVNFPAGSVSIALDYTPAAGEVTGSLFMVYVDGKGAVTWLDKSSYDSSRMLAEVPHFSTYGVACKAPAPVFTDITGHWAKEDIEFVAARGLLSGTGNNLFSPDGTMTRGMFVTALGRLAGINPDSYQTRSFTDVKADAYYAAYVEWAAQKNIVKGTGDKLFSPDAPVTREQMAVMMTNYAGQTGYSISAPLAAVTFTDNGKISAWAAKEVAAMQRAGIVKGKDGNIFDPQGNATRAEVSAVLRRFVEIVIDPATATGWVKNDSGHWLYYQGGKALTGWQTIGKLRYYFNADGVMHEGWKQDTGTGKWYYWTNAGAATGWREIGGKWYYFNENGVMSVNTKVDGYEIRPDGARKEG